MYSLNEHEATTKKKLNEIRTTEDGGHLKVGQALSLQQTTTYRVRSLISH